LEKEMIKRTKGLVIIDDITVSLLKMPSATQKKLDAFVAEVGNTRIKQQQKLTAEQEALANKELAASLKNDPNLLISKCLDLVADGKIAIPNFQCFGSGGAVPVFPVQ
jgi:uncharacterized protein with NRDE domain